MTKLTDTSAMPFGIHKGKRMIDIEQSYLLWLYINDKCNAEVKEYIKDNLDVLRSQQRK